MGFYVDNGTSYPKFPSFLVLPTQQMATSAALHNGVVPNGDTHTTPELINVQDGPAGNVFPQPANWIPVIEAPLYTPRKIRVITIGAGFSGLMVAHKVSTHSSEIHQKFIDES